jgi:predicted MFS family arabinose efflux permease
MLISLAVSTVSYALFAAATDLWLLFASRLLAGGGGANIAVAQAFIVDTTSERERARGMGLIGAAFGLGFVFGPAIGGVLATWGHAAPGIAAAVICGANWLVALWRLPESRREGANEGRVWGRTGATILRRLPRTLHRPPLSGLIAVSFAVVFSFATMETTLSLLCATQFGLAPREIYWLFGFMGLATSAVQGGLIGRLARTRSEGALLVSGCALLALGLLVTPFAWPPGALLLALASVACGQGIASPTLSSMISKLSEAAEQGEVLGTAQAMGSLARVLGPVSGGLLFDWGPAQPYLATGLLMAAVTILARRVTMSTARAAGGEVATSLRSQA